MKVIIDWFYRYFSDPQIVNLMVLLSIIFTSIIFMGEDLLPVLAAVVIAYLLEGLVQGVQRLKIPRFIAVLIVYLSFMTFLLFVFLGLMPMLYKQLTQLFQQIPIMIAEGQQSLLQLPERYPDIISEDQVLSLIDTLREEATVLGQQILAASVGSVVSLITVMIYFILMPLLIFFFLKDKVRILQWFSKFLPKERQLMRNIWHDVDIQIGNYVRGKFWEILIIWSFSFMTFAIMELQFAMLLGVLVGLSVIIPYIGAVVVTIPVVLIAYFQWGWGSDFIYLITAYAVIQALDGNVLVPLLFSEVVNLHPVAIIVAILVFGGLWGFWGVFFAIPLATLVSSILTAWPTQVSTSDRVEAV